MAHNQRRVEVKIINQIEGQPGYRVGMTVQMTYDQALPLIKTFKVKPTKPIKL